MFDAFLSSIILLRNVTLYDESVRVKYLVFFLLLWCLTIFISRLNFVDTRVVDVEVLDVEDVEVLYVEVVAVGLMLVSEVLEDTPVDCLDVAIYGFVIEEVPLLGVVLVVVGCVITDVPSSRLVIPERGEPKDPGDDSNRDEFVDGGDRPALSFDVQVDALAESDTEDTESNGIVYSSMSTTIPTSSGAILSLSGTLRRCPGLRWCDSFFTPVVGLVVALEVMNWYYVDIVNKY